MVAKRRSIPVGGKSGRRGAGRKKKSSWRGFLRCGAGVGGLVLLARFFFLQTVAVPSRSMEDTLLVGDYLLIDRFTYGAQIPFLSLRLPGLRDPRPGEVVAFRSPLDPDRIYLKRCIAVAGQMVEIRNKAVYVDGDRVPDPPFSKYVDARVLPAGQSTRDNYGPEEVPEGRIFVLGDNRDNSRDSRYWGMLPLEWIVGRALCVCWSWRSEPEREEREGLSWLAGSFGRIRWSRIGAKVK